MAEDLQYLQGVDTVAFARKLADAATAKGKLIPWQTSLSFDPQRNTDTNATKDGSVSTTASVETDLEVEFINNTSEIADAMYDSLFDGDVLEIWVIYRKRKNADGKYFAWYQRAAVTEDSNDNDADDNSTRDVTFTVNGTPKRGWLTLPQEAQDELDYIFRGIDESTTTDPTGGGTPWGTTPNPNPQD